jgi:hypothetical protein
VDVEAVILGCLFGGGEEGEEGDEDLLIVMDGVE